MSRIAKYPVEIPAKVEVALAGGRVDVKGPLGSLSH
ncbi:MAG TPA: 50S ribosomal protein L6, partial [Casimicrobium sp.]|nr:50S ribosomal protein L6 [Casimicrobium sp.]